MSSNIIADLFPSLRFPSFSGEWVVKPLGELCDSILVGFPFKGQDITDDVSGHPILRACSIGDGLIRHGKDYDRYYPNDTKPLEKYKVQPGDIVIAMDGSVGKNIALVSKEEENYLLIQRVARLRITKYPIQLIYQQIVSQRFKDYATGEKVGAVIAHISQKQIESFPIFLPTSMEEQEKVSSCLLELDKMIFAQGRFVKKLDSHKNGLMQKLFPQQGEKTPQIRFPGFSDDWVEKKFKDFTFSAGKKNKKNLPYERYSISNEFGFCPQSDQFEGGGGYLKDIDCSLYIIVSPKSFAYNPARINVGSMGYQDLGKDVIVSSLYEVFQTTGDCDDTFLWHWFHSNAFRKMVLDVQEGGVRQYFYYNKLQECSICLPSIAEQKKIAGVLSEVDRLLSAEKAKDDVLRTYKKGLMQKLFPII